MKQENFKGIWIPKELWERNELSIQEKIFLVTITALDNDKGCYASNDYFAEFFNLSKCRCSNILKELEKKECIKIQYSRKAGTATVNKRVIRLGKKGREILKRKKTVSESKSDISKIITDYFENEITSFENYKDINTIYKIKDNIIDKLNILLEEEKEVSDDSTKEKSIHQLIEDESISRKLKDSLKNYTQYCKDRGKEIESYTTIKILLEQIGEKYTDENHLIESIETAICSQYQGVFPIKRWSRGKKGTNIQSDESYAARRLRELEEEERNAGKGFLTGDNNN